MTRRRRDECPACEPGACKAYPLIRRMMASRPDLYRKIHDRLNESDAERAARLIAEEMAGRLGDVRRGCCE